MPPTFHIPNSTLLTPYFGARYYQSTHSFWLSVDPLADKYPNLSPYAYCAGNPVRLVDLDGRVPIETIWDIGNVVYDVGAAIINHYKGDYNAEKSNWTDLGMDVAALFIPYVPAGATKASD